MNLLRTLFVAFACLSSSPSSPSFATAADTEAGPETETAAAATEEPAATNVSAVAPSQLRQNFNPDRTEAWGDIELVGGGQKWEFVKGLFGGDLICHPLQLVHAPEDNRLGCNEHTEDVKGKLLVVMRGQCSFADKVAFAQDAGAAGVVIGNTGEELIRMPAGWLKYPKDIAIKIPVVIVRQTTALSLRKIINRDAAVYAQIIAKHWTVKGEFPVGPCAEDDAVPAATQVSVTADGNVVVVSDSASQEDGEVLSLGEEGGQIRLHNEGLEGVTQTRFEYLYARFGGPRPRTTRELVWADPADACGPLKNAAETKDKFVLTKRGGCAFTDKGHNVDEAGGAAAIVINNAANVVQMAQGDIKDYYVTTPTVMISNAAGDQLATALQSAGDSPVTLSFHKFDVQANMWDSLNNLKTPQKWPVSETSRAGLYEELLAEHDPAQSPTGSIERKSYLDILYAQATKFWGASI